MKRALQLSASELRAYLSIGAPDRDCRRVQIGPYRGFNCIRAVCALLEARFPGSRPLSAAPLVSDRSVTLRLNLFTNPTRLGVLSGLCVFKYYKQTLHRPTYIKFQSTQTLSN